MNDHTTIAVRRLTVRATGPIARWLRRLSGHMQAGDTFARQAGWSVTPTGFGGRIYRDPRFSQPSATRTPEPPSESAAPAADPYRLAPAPGAPPAPGTARHRRPQARWSRKGGADDQQYQ